MNKFLRIISTLIVGVGLILLFSYLSFQNSIDKSQLLNKPSYYTLQNYWYLLISGCGCVAFSIISCFLAWNKKMDEKVEILPNAVAAEKRELFRWLAGSSLDTDKNRNRKIQAAQKEERNNDTPIMNRTEKPWKFMSNTEDTAAVATTKTATAASEKTEMVHDETILDDLSSMTVLCKNATVLTNETETDDDSTVIENK